MSNVISVRPDSGERLFAEQEQADSSVADRLNGIRRLLRQAVPEDASISFDYGRQLQVHIDVMKNESVILIESMLPKLGDNVFHSLRRAATPHRPFFHRISAVVNG